MVAIPEFAPDAVYAARGPGSPLATDLSGESTNITFNTSWVYETSSTRADLTGSRTIDILLTLSDGNVGVLYDYHTSQMSVNAGVVTLTVNGSGVLSHTIQNITASTLEDYVMSWATEANPLTTGAGDAYRSELHIWNLALGTYEMSSVTHAVQVSPGGGGSTMVFGAADSAGTNAYDDQLNEVRLSSTFHSSTETAHCYVYPTIGVYPVLEPDLRTLYDRWSGTAGTATGTTYDYDDDARTSENGQSIAYASPATPSVLTLSAWVRFDAAPSVSSFPFFLASSSGPYGARMYISATRQYVFSVDYATTDMSIFTATSYFPADGEWHHVAATWDGSATATNSHLYFDGVEVTYSGQINGAGAQSPIDSTNYLGLNFEGDFRYSKIFHAELTAAQVQDIYELEKPPDTTRLEFPVPEQSCGLGDDGELDGPVRIMAAKNLHNSSLQLCGPIINEIGTGVWSEDSGWTMTDPDDANYTIQGEWLFCRPVPWHINRVNVRAHVQQNGASALALGIRFYSSNTPGPIANPIFSGVGSPTVYTSTVTRTADDGTGTGAGEWVDFGQVRVARDATGHAYFYIGFYPGSITDYRINALVVEPALLTTAGSPGGGVGFG